MVVERVSDNKQEFADWYKEISIPENEDDDNIGDCDLERLVLERCQAEVELHNCLFQEFHHGSAQDFLADQQANRDTLLPFQHQLVQERWSPLHNKRAYLCLQDTIAEEVSKISQNFHHC